MINRGRSRNFWLGAGSKLWFRKDCWTFCGKLLLTETTTCFSICERRSPLAREILGTLSKDVFGRRTSTGSEAFSLFICPDANKLVLLSFFSLLKTIYPRVSTKPLPSDAKSSLPVDVRRSKTLLLKLPTVLRAEANRSQEAPKNNNIFSYAWNWDILFFRGLMEGRGRGGPVPPPVSAND